MSETASCGAPPRTAAPAARVVFIDQRAIERALARRQRYKYVQPRVEREGAGWKIVSPNCSRNVDPEGGEIDVAWLLRSGCRWRLHARDHVNHAWVSRAQDLTLAQALALLCEDPNREFWQ